MKFSDIPTSITDVPNEWIYQFYLGTKEILDGRPIRLHSVFNSDSTPSMFLYVKDGKYRWKDFSSGKGGNSIELVKELLENRLGIPVMYEFVVKEILKSYRAWVRVNGSFKETEVETIHEGYMVDFAVRDMEFTDLMYWSRIGAGNELLQEYNVYPLEWFSLSRRMKSQGDSIINNYGKISLDHSYGFLNNRGELLKIYNPFSKDFKHINVKKDLLGREQLGKNSTCLLASSMKDLLAIKALKLKLEVVAPMSENTYIDLADMQHLNDLYENVLTLFDNDRPGILAMMRYKELYGTEFVYFPHYKDIAEARETSKDEIWLKHELTMLINKKINAKDTKETEKSSTKAKEESKTSGEIAAS